jgi:hypothetical protein
VPEVMMVRLNVWLIALLMISRNVPRNPSFKSSRMRSKITTLSLSEKPMMVNAAATMGALSCLPEMKKMPRVTNTSWTTASTAPMEKENS